MINDWNIGGGEDFTILDLKEKAINHKNLPHRLLKDIGRNHPGMPAYFTSPEANQSVQGMQKH